MRTSELRSRVVLRVLSCALLGLGCSGGLESTSSREPVRAGEPRVGEVRTSEPGATERGARVASAPAALAGEASGPEDRLEPSLAPSRATSTPSEGGWFASPRQRARIFASGHSLVDHVFGPISVDGGPITALARRTGKDHHSVFQGGPGSPARVRREDLEHGLFAAPEWGSFDVLVLTERADPHSCVIWENTATEHGWVVDRVREAGGRLEDVFLYQTWWGFADDDPPTLRTWPAWADYVREELALHECVAQQISRSRGVTARVLPAGLALAELMVAIDGGRIPGLTAYDVFSRDHVHLVELGHRFLALVVYASVYRTPTRGIPMAGVPEAQARAMQEIVDRVVGDYYARAPRHTLEQCRRTLARICELHEQGCEHYLAQGFPDGSI